MAYIGYIYKITNKINEKSYIGKTNNIKRRWGEHKGGKGNTAILNKAIKKYGIDNFDFSIVEEKEFDSIDALNQGLSQMEIDYIAKYNTYKRGYNATIGGEGASGHHVSDELKQLYREQALERYKSEEERLKCGDGMRGKHHTKEVREKIKKALLNRDPVIYEKIAVKMKGKHRDHEMIMKAAAKRKKAILQYDKFGNFLKEYNGIMEAGYNTTANISACCKGKIGSAYGYIWRFKEGNNYPLHIEVPNNVRAQYYNTIVQMTKEGDIINTYKSLPEASRVTGIGRRAIGNCLYGWSNSAGGYIWKFKENEEDVA